jgi:hypothetical protein
VAEVLDQADLVLGQQCGPVCIDACRCGNRLGRPLIVTAQHDNLGDAKAFEGAHHGRCDRADAIGKTDQAADVPCVANGHE